MTNPTAPPWTIERTAFGARSILTAYTTHIGPDGDMPSVICVLPSDRCISREEREANARLIVASGKLLHQLKTVLACIESVGECLGDMQGMREAIALAEAP